MSTATYPKYAQNFPSVTFPQGLFLVFVALYATHIAPSLPNEVTKWFAHPLVKGAFIALFVWSLEHNGLFAIVVAFAIYELDRIYSMSKKSEPQVQVY